MDNKHRVKEGGRLPDGKEEMMEVCTMANLDKINERFQEIEKRVEKLEIKDYLAFYNAVQECADEIEKGRVAVKKRLYDMLAPKPRGFRLHEEVEVMRSGYWEIGRYIVHDEGDRHPHGVILAGSNELRWYTDNNVRSRKERK